jgi:anti-anti-sigma factor
VEDGGDAGWTLALAGELDMANAATLSAELERAERDAAKITIDLRELRFIDSTGIAVLVAAHRRLDGDDDRLRLIRSDADGVRRVLELTGLDRELPFVDSGGD